MVKRYRKRPIVIEALQYKKDRIGDLLDFVPQDVICYCPDENEYYIETLEGNLKCMEGDYIIKGINGEFYPCKADIFEKTYELVRDNLEVKDDICRKSWKMVDRAVQGALRRLQKLVF